MSREKPLLLAAITSVVFTLALANPACTDETIPLASVQSASSPKCTTNADCQADNTFCSKVSCTDAAGECVAIPPDCNGQLESDVCGCNGDGGPDNITYYNDCLRKQHGTIGSTPGACAAGKACQVNGSQPCPDPNTELCAVEFNGKGSCANVVEGTCWALPPACPASPDGTDRFDSCTDLTARCMDVCTAIRTMQPYRHSGGFCPSPPQGD